MLVPLERLTVGIAAGAEKILAGFAAVPLNFIWLPKHLSGHVCMIEEAITMDESSDHNLQIAAYKVGLELRLRKDYGAIK